MNKLKTARNEYEAAETPARVSEKTIARCRVEVESIPKRLIRSFLVPCIRWTYRLKDLGEGFQWGLPFRLTAGSRIGRYVYVGAGFEATGTVSIGDLTMVSTDCRIIGSDHLCDVVGTPTRLAFASGHRTTTIGADVWIGTRSTIREGIQIGDGAVIGAGSVVVRDVEPYTVVAGVPARLIRRRFDDENLAVHVEALMIS